MAMKQERVIDWMTADVITVTPSTNLPEAHQLMKMHKIRRLPVVDEKNQVIGILTLGDVRGAEASSATSLSVWELNYLLNRLKVKEFMTPDPVTIQPDTTIGEAALLMLQHRVSGLPVLNEKRQLVGMITESDIFSMVVLHEWEAKELQLETPTP